MAGITGNRRFPTLDHGVTDSVHTHNPETTWRLVQDTSVTILRRGDTNRLTGTIRAHGATMRSFPLSWSCPRMCARRLRTRRQRGRARPRDVGGRRFQRGVRTIKPFLTLRLKNGVTMRGSVEAELRLWTAEMDVPLVLEVEPLWSSLARTSARSSAVMAPRANPPLTSTSQPPARPARRLSPTATPSPSPMPQPRDTSTRRRRSRCKRARYVSQKLRSPRWPTRWQTHHLYWHLLLVPPP